MAWSELMSPETWLPILTHPDQSISSSLIKKARGWMTPTALTATEKD